MQQWLERLGYAAQLVGAAVQAAGGAAGEVADDLGDEAADAGEEAAAPMGGAAAGMLASAAGGWLATRLLGAREISLGRAVLAGVIGTLLYDAVSAVDGRLAERKLDATSHVGATLTDDPELQRYLDWAAHYAAGVGLAILYARFAHRRLPLPPFAQGAAFGLLDAAALGYGGLLPLAARVLPGVRTVPGVAGVLGTDPELTARTALRHLAFGVGMGVVYGDG